MGLCHLLQVLTAPAPLLPSELLPALLDVLLVIPLVDLVLLLPFLIAGSGRVKGTHGDSPSLNPLRCDRAPCPGPPAPLPLAAAQAGYRLFL